MGKNTMMKRCIRLYCEETGDEKWTPMLDALVGNVGMIFTKARALLQLLGFRSNALQPGGARWQQGHMHGPALWSGL